MEKKEENSLSKGKVIPVIPTEKENLLFRFLKTLGSTAGIFVSILALTGVGYTAGVFSNNFIKDKEILDITREHYKELKNCEDEKADLVSKNQILKDTTNMLKTKSN